MYTVGYNQRAICELFQSILYRSTMDHCKATLKINSRDCTGSTTSKLNASLVFKPVKLERLFYFTSETFVIWRLSMVSINTIIIF